MFNFDVLAKDIHFLSSSALSSFEFMPNVFLLAKCISPLLYAKLHNFGLVTGICVHLFSAHRGFKTPCWVSVRDLAIIMYFFGVNGFLWMKLTS